MELRWDGYYTHNLCINLVCVHDSAGVCCLLMFWVPRSCIDLPLLCILETDLLDLLVRKPGVKCSFTVSSVNHFLIIPGVKTKQL